MEIHRFELGGFRVSAYVVTAPLKSDPGGPPEALLIDAPEGAEAIVAFCHERRLTPRLLVNTHGHADHIHANRLLKKTWPDLEIACGQADAPLLVSPIRNLSVLVLRRVKSPPPDRLLSEGDRIEVGEAALEVLETPGHSPGGISLYAPDGPDGRPVVFTGDALFAGSIGRTDFPGARHATLVQSIREKLLVLPPETVVYPGHGEPTTIGEEARTNPFIQV
jgi:glyoxylase-like metal-dependent hydrolase (beta-lactamase superfamily II)